MTALMERTERGVGTWPGGARFAFTIFDDTDWATVDTAKPVYDLLEQLGIRITKSVWVHPGEAAGTNAGSTCDTPEYLDWIRALKRAGFEIGLHNISPGTSNRGDVQRGLERFRELFGDYPAVHCNHVGCQDSLYWGESRLTGWRRSVYRAAARGKATAASFGHVESDPRFWGDLCRTHITYVRSFVFRDLNALSVCPELPYHDPSKPFVNFWFPSSDGAKLSTFLQNFTRDRIDRLADECGLCIGYVHFGRSFTKNGAVDPDFARRMEYIASKGGWFAPVSQVLDHIRDGARPEERILPPQNRARIERRWLWEKARYGTS